MQPKTNQGSSSHDIVVEGAIKTTGARARSRLLMTMTLFAMIFVIIGGRLVFLGFSDSDYRRAAVADRNLVSRPDIVDRNGEVLATDIKTASLFAEPRRIVDADEAVEQLVTVLPDLDVNTTYRRLRSGTGFAWLRRELTPGQQNEIQKLGIPGIGFRTEKRRFYPGGPTASHVLGLVNVDNQGTAGMEKFIDDQGLADLQAAGLTESADLEPVQLSIDLRVQHIVRDELASAMERYQAIAAGAVVLNARTGEVVAMSSLPDYNPNNPYNALEKDRLNRMSAGIFEMGSTFKTFTTAMALDSGKVHLSDKFDARKPIRIARFTINDFHGKRRWLSVPEIFIYSSNIGTAKMADTIGIEGHRAFLKRIGLLDRMDTELPEVARPTEPREWKKLHSITISFGHGMATTPLQTAVAAAALLNGGKLIQPTFLPRNEREAELSGVQVLDPKTSDAMRYLFRLNVEKGSGRRAEVPGFFVGGKTGTAEKVINGRYVSDKRFNAFLAAFPVNDPQYVVLVILDEPKPEKKGVGATAGSNAAPTVAGIIRRSASLLGVKPEFGHESRALLVSH
ncbi:MAG: peptidoglycan D,D-transpeptidase FtsI family protein [Rhizobiaceae bacterium]